MLPIETNLLLANLPPRTIEQIRSRSAVVEFQLRERLYETGTMTDVFFPLDGILSLIQELEDGTPVEVGMVGAEGLAGISAILGIPSVPHTGLVQGRGFFVRCPADVVRELVMSDESARDMMFRWMHVSYAQAMQLAACNRVHNADLRLAHWLLMIHDRAASDEISVTQEFLGLMLATRRATINEAMAKLVATGAIRSGRGRVTVIDRALLEKQSCECYAVMVAEYEKVLGFVPRLERRGTEID